MAWLDAGYAIRYSDLERAEMQAATPVKEGDAVLVRTGRDVREARFAPNYNEQAGFHPDALIWAHERGVSVLGSDGSNECDPPLESGFEWPAHVLALVAMGLPLVDNAVLEDLAATGRSEFVLVIAPVRSPVGPALW